jgi:hypothetical protein
LLSFILYLQFEDANGNNKVDAGEKIVQTYSLNRSFSKGNSGSTSALLYSTVVRFPSSESNKKRK